MLITPFLQALALSTTLLVPNGCQEPHTVPGPEAEDLVARVRGTIVISEPVGGLRTVLLPRKDLSTPRVPDSGLLPVHSVAGPDARGRIAFIENDMLKKHHSLKLIGLDGEGEATVFEAQGDTLWEHAAGKYLALDARGELLALVARAEGMQLRSRDAYLMEGELEVWRVESRERVASPHRALDDTLAWFPDGKRLAYTALIDPAEAEALLRVHVRPDEEFGRATKGWERVPAVHVLDLETGRSRAVHAGERPLVSPDGRSILLQDFELHWRILDLETNQSRPFAAVGAIHPGAIAFVDPDTVLYWAWPTEGSATEYTEHNSPLVGKKQMRALKLVDLRDGRFQTAVPFVDPRHAVSFGNWGPDGR